MKKYLVIVLFTSASFLFLYAIATKDNTENDFNNIDKNQSQINDSLVANSDMEIKQDTTVKIDSIVIDKILEEKKKPAKKGLVSWYGKWHHGKLTASGKLFDMNKMTAAHKTLPFGTKVKFINPANGKFIVVEINDRGPYVKKREFDLSSGAFQKLAALNKGLLSLHYVILN